MSEPFGKAGTTDDLILLGKYLRGGLASGGQRSPREQLQALLDAILHYGLYPEQPGLTGYAEDLKRLAGQLDERAEEGTADEVIAATTGLLGEHRKAKDKIDQKQLDEIQAMVVMFHRSVAALTQGSHRSVARLSTLEKDLRHATGLSDLAALRGRLSNVLDFVQREREEERTRSSQVVGELEQDFRLAQATLLECGIGMPGREQAVATLRRVWREDSLGAMVRLDQVGQVAERHGNETAQRLVLAFLDAVAREIALPCSTFQWGSDALFLLLERNADRDKARRLIRQKAAQIPAAFMVDVAARKTLFRCPHRWLVLGSDEEPDPDKAVARFQTFLQS